MNSSKGRLLRVIAVFKFFKCATLLALAFGAFHLLHKDVGEVAEHWAMALKLDPGNHYVDLALARASNLNPKQIKELGLGGMLYAALFFTEGIGLWMRKRWGEWATVIITTTLVPLEVYEIFRHPSVVKVLVLLINISVVVYLIWRMRTDK